jgi:hypothetical protein
MASASSSLGSTAVSSKLTKRHAARITSSNAASLTFDGLVNPLRYGTNRMANASIFFFRGWRFKVDQGLDVSALRNFSLSTQ